MSIRFSLFFYPLLFASVLFLLSSCTESSPAPAPSPPEKQPATVTELQSERVTIPAGSNLYQVLYNAGLSPRDLLALVDVFKKTAGDTRVAAGSIVRLFRRPSPENRIARVEVVRSRSRSVILERKSVKGWEGRTRDYPITLERATFKGTVVTNLWDSARIAGMDPQLIVDLSLVFASQVDFNREVRKGDRWRLVVERKIINGRGAGWGNILAVEYENNGQVYTGIRFPAGKNSGYFDPDGDSLRRMFLKSPLRFGRVTSRFSKRRFHPVLKKHRPHYGVDYGAPTGTPVMAVGKGRIARIGRYGGSGKMIHIRHNGVYQTAYLHLSGYAKGLRRGSKVEQGEIIGYVGATGLATGPHLHFSFYEYGRYVDPLGRKFPSAEGVPRADRARYRQLAEQLTAELPEWDLIAGFAGDSSGREFLNLQPVLR